MISEDEFLSRVEKVPLHRLDWPLAKQKGVEVWMRRDDLIDDHLSGNKFYKLFYNLHVAKLNGYQKLLSFGGAYSNHIYALAAAAKDFGFESIGMIRGERPKQLSPTLKDAEAWGMQLHFVSRADYCQKSSSEFIRQLENSYGDFFLIPEGGANNYGIRGTKILGAAIRSQISGDLASVCLASGTGNTLAGVAAGLAVDGAPTNVLGFSVLKEARKSSFDTLGMLVVDSQNSIDEISTNWRLISGFHGGGYGKKLPLNIQQFMLVFENMAGFQLDPVYTVKMCWGVAQLLAKDYWPRGSRLVLVHTGGLQGRRGFNL